MTSIRRWLKKTLRQTLSTRGVPPSPVSWSLDSPNPVQQRWVRARLSVCEVGVEHAGTSGDHMKIL